MASALKNRSVSDSQHINTACDYTPTSATTPLSDSGVGTAISAIDMAAVRIQLQSMAKDVPPIAAGCSRDAPPPPVVVTFEDDDEAVTPVGKDEIAIHAVDHNIHHVPVEEKSMEEADRPRAVRFADEIGFDLEEVRVMQEPSDCPPKLSANVLRSILGEEQYSAQCTEATWTLGFAQPAGDYIKFRTTVDTQNVSLENVVLQNRECKMSGTVRVKNIAFEKSVFIRYTDNNWLSYYDRPCVYKPNRLGDPSYDTFTFTVDVPQDDEQREILSFCVCYKTGTGDSVHEYWDSNGGTNYSVMSAERKARMETHQLTTVVKSTQSMDSPADAPRTSDAWTLNMGTHWGNFSSWKNLTTDAPYY